MKISELTLSEYKGPQSGLTWSYRQPGVLLGDEIQKMFASAMNDSGIRSAVKGDKDGAEAGMDYQAMMKAQSDAITLAFRVCAISVVGLENDDGTPFDLGSFRTGTVELCGVAVKAMTMAGLEYLDAGAISDDIREIGSRIVSDSKMGGAQKKT